ncbi:hypothetical protein KBD45_01080 [Candidatus Dojkabacteria bacterium]|nr:hypothetical protein [Candidatus Dojkabacteria bacterium]
MAIPSVKSKKEIDFPEEFEGIEEGSHELDNVQQAYYDEENPNYIDINDSDETTEFLREFEKGTERDDDSRDDKSPDSDREDNVSY